MAAELTFAQVLFASLASGAIGGAIGAGASLSVARLTGKQAREAAEASRIAQAEDALEQQRVADLRSFQDAVDEWSRAWRIRLAAWVDHSLDNPPGPTTFLELLSAQAQLRTAAARVGDADLIHELDAMSQLTIEAGHRGPVRNARLGERAGDLTALLVFGASLMIGGKVSWKEVQASATSATESETDDLPLSPTRPED